MALGKPNNNESNWVSFSDIMTGLMVIFMFIAISYMYEADKKVSPLRKLSDFQEELYDTLNAEFQEDFNIWGVDLEEDLTMKFTKLGGLFDDNKAEIKDTFKDNLDKFVPRYFEILLRTNYRKYIAEIRIEGHTSPQGDFDTEDENYMYNLRLSQRRSAEVLSYIRNMDYYKGLDPNDKNELQYWLTANGLSYGRTLDDQKQLTKISHEATDDELSKRVEFRVVTTSESLLNKSSEK